jgi:DNA-binding NtrC family response regulator
MQRLLCVDDEAFILSSLTRLFKTQYEVLTAPSAIDALKVVGQTRVDVVISDQRMPGMTGVEFLKHVQQISPHTMRVLLTGYADLPATIEAVNSGEVFRYVTKPWNNDSLRMTVALAMRAALNTHEHNARVAKSPAPAPAAHRSIDILVLDPDPGLAATCNELLGSEHKVYSARDLDQAADQLEAHASIGVLLTEARLGQDTLVHVLATLRAVRPSLVSIVASRFADAQMVIQLINQGQIYRFVGKPVSPEKLKTEIIGALRRHIQLKVVPQLSDRHAAEISKPVQETIAQAAPSGLRGLFAKVAGLFR